MPTSETSGSDGAWTAAIQIVDEAISAGTVADLATKNIEEGAPEDSGLEDLRATIDETITLVVRALAERRTPTGDEAEAVVGAASAMLARQGVPVEVVLHRYRVVAGELWHAMTDAAAAAESLSPLTLLELARLMWDGTDVLLVTAARAHRLAEMELERQHEEERRSFLRALLLGSIQPEDLRRRAGAFGLRMDTAYLPFRARAGAGLPLHRLEAAVLAVSTSDTPGLTALLEGTLLGVLPSIPDLGGLPAVVGIGPPARLEVAKASFQHATRAMETAGAFDLHGVFRVEDLPVRALVASEPHIGDALVARYLGPLDPMGQFGPAVQRTLREFFARGMRVEETARALDVHPNTLRHRLRRFEEITGADLGQTEELFRVWWALERRALQDRLGFSGPTTNA